MALVKNSSGLIVHTDFTLGIPAWGTALTAGGGTANVVANRLVLDTTIDTDASTFIYTSALPSSKEWVVRSESLLSVNESGVFPLILTQDSSPTFIGDLASLEPFFRMFSMQAGGNFFISIYMDSISGEIFIFGEDPWIEGVNTLVEIMSDSTNIKSSLMDSSASVVNSGITAWVNMIDDSKSFWISSGDLFNDSIAGIASLNYFQVYKSNSINIVDLNSGNAARVCNSLGAPLSSATEVAGTATLDVSTSLVFPFDGSVRVYEDNTWAVEIDRYTGSDIWGGDEYQIESPILKHYILQISRNSNFTDIEREIKTHSNYNEFEYFDGAVWQIFPITGIDVDIYDGNNIRWNGDIGGGDRWLRVKDYSK